MPQVPDRPALLVPVEAHLGQLIGAPCKSCLHWLHSLWRSEEGHIIRKGGGNRNFFHTCHKRDTDVFSLGKIVDSGWERSQ